MEQSVEAFRQFYELANSHRRLQWVHTLGQITLKARFGAKTYDLIMAPQQAAVLNLFNDVDALSYGEIMERLEMTDEDLMRMLHSLSCAKYKLLTKEPGSRTIGKSDKFTVNEDFKVTGGRRAGPSRMRSSIDVALSLSPVLSPLCSRPFSFSSPPYLTPCPLQTNQPNQAITRLADRSPSLGLPLAPLPSLDQSLDQSLDRPPGVARRTSSGASRCRCRWWRTAARCRRTWQRTASPRSRPRSSAS